MSFHYFVTWHFGTSNQFLPILTSSRFGIWHFGTLAHVTLALWHLRTGMLQGSDGTRAGCHGTRLMSAYKRVILLKDLPRHSRFTLGTEVDVGTRGPSFRFHSLLNQTRGSLTSVCKENVVMQHLGTVVAGIFNSNLVQGRCIF
jgi:hypothetical protein